MVRGAIGGKWQLAKEVQVHVQKEMARMEELHDKELKNVQTNMELIEDRNTVQFERTASKIKQLEDTI